MTDESMIVVDPDEREQAIDIARRGLATCLPAMAANGVTEDSVRDTPSPEEAFLTMALYFRRRHAGIANAADAWLVYANACEGTAQYCKTYSVTWDDIPREIPS